MKYNKSQYWLAAIGLALSIQFAQAVQPNYSQWNQLAKKYVVPINDGHSTQVNYAGFAENKVQFESYLKSLSSVSKNEFNKWSKNTQLAFLINAYNAWTVDLILTKYPNLKSIKDLGSVFSSPWKKDFIPLFGKQVSLDYIEHTLIRGSGKYDDPRIHFAVNCASIGCPSLLNQAYTGEKLNSQLNSQMYHFLSDTTRNRYKNDKLQVSAIFKWYKGDFQKGWQGYHSLGQFFAKNAKALNIPTSKIDALKQGKIDISYLKYNWELNKTR